MIPPEAPNFSAFVFKIQANMNKRHRDRVAFLRVCSGVFEKDMVITNAREGAGDPRVAAVPVLRRQARNHREGVSR